MTNLTKNELTKVKDFEYDKIRDTFDLIIADSLGAGRIVYADSWMTNSGITKSNVMIRMIDLSALDDDQSTSWANRLSFIDRNL